jgi:hypothetical protein
MYGRLPRLYAHHTKSTASTELIIHINKNGVLAPIMDNIPNEKIRIPTPNPSNQSTHLDSSLDTVLYFLVPLIIHQLRESVVYQLVRYSYVLY